MVASLTLEQFVAMTLRVIAAEGLEAYQPTIALIETREIVVIGDVPAEVAPHEALIEAIGRRGLARSDFAFGVRSGSVEVTVGRCINGDCEFELIVANSSGLERRPTGVPAWWSAV